jgi:hypothetical protein
LDAAIHIQRPIPYTHFSKLFDRYWGYVSSLSTEEQLDEISVANPTNRPKSSDVKALRQAARNNLRDMLSEMTARKVFLHGAEVQCHHCLASLWYHVNDLQSIVVCRGCRRDVNLPAEIPWSYSLNELVVSAVRDHGVSPVIRTAFRLFERSRDCFCFLPGIEVRAYRGDAETHICELDLVWIRDGEFGVAEVKQKPKKFKVTKKLAMILNAARPNRFLLVSASGAEDEMEKVRLVVSAALTSGISIEAWNPSVFAHSSHSDWNTVAYSMFG